MLASHAVTLSTPRSDLMKTAPEVRTSQIFPEVRPALVQPDQRDNVKRSDSFLEKLNIPEPQVNPRSEN